MSEYIDITAKTLNEAITEACVKLGITSDRLDYQVIEKGSTGFLGIGNKPAVIRARAKEEEKVPEEPVISAPQPEKTEAPSFNNEPVHNDPVPAAEEPKQEPEEQDQHGKNESRHSVRKETLSNEEFEAKAKDFLGKVFDAMNMEVEIDTSVDNVDNLLNIDLKGREMGVLIGKRGQTLDALQYLTKLAVNNQAENKIKVKVDTEDYRDRRKKTLENLANNIAQKVKRTGRSVDLEPMNPFERRIIHSALQNNRYVTTHSEGEEPDRYVVVSPKEGR